MTDVDPNQRQRSSGGSHDPPCPYCGETRQPRELAWLLRRCVTCELVFPLGRRARSAAVLPPLEALSSIAPGCLLRERYRLVELIGEGAHGLTYFAQHEFLNHPCVVKIIPHRIRDASDAAARRLRHEAQTGFRVNHPNVVRVLDCDAIEGVWYFVMEHVDGVDLEALVGAGVQLGWQQGVRIALDAAAGLAAIHQAGLVHRDVKPANLLLGTDGRVRVTDLGLAGLACGAPSPTRAGHAAGVGTLHYAAPELLQPGAPIDERADLYSLGATLHHVVTARAPHASGGVFQSLIDAQSRPSQWPEDGPPDVPDWFIHTVLRLLAPDPQQRFASAEELLACLRPSPAPPAEPRTPPAPSEERQPRGIAVLPFNNESSAAGDEWLGFALADSLARELSQSPGVFVADHEQLQACLARLEAGAYPHQSARLLGAGRLVGAGTVITGRFRRTERGIRFLAEVHRAGQRESFRIGPLESPLSKLVELQAGLHRQVIGLLELAPGQRRAPSPATTDAITLQMREKLIRGKQAYLQGHYETAIRLAREVVDQNPGLVEPIQYIGACYARLGQYEEAAAHHGRLMEIAEQRGDKQLLLEAHANMGVMYYFKGEYETAQEHYAQAAAIAEQVGVVPAVAQIHNNSGFTLFRLGRPREAEQAFRRAIDTFRMCQALASLIGPFNGMGNVLVEQLRYHEAREYYERALRLAEEIRDHTNTGVSHMHLARCASLQGRFADAKNEFNLALSLLEGTSFWNVLARTYEYMAEMNLRLGDLAEAVRCADKRIQLAQRHANRTMESAAWRQKAEALRSAGRTREADTCWVRADSAGSQNVATPS